MVIVDARGLSCPEPVVMTRKAMADKQAQYQVLADNFLFFITKSALFPKRRVQLSSKSRHRKII